MSARAVSVRALAGGVLSMTLLAGCAGTNANPTGPDGADNRYVAGDGSSQLIKDRKPGPQAKGTTLDGKPLSLADLTGAPGGGAGGKVVVVNFWASWCAPCRGEAPALQKLYEEHKGKGVEFVGIDIKDSGKEAALAFERTFKIGYPSIYDPDGQVTLAFRVIPPSAVPSTLILDRQGRVAARIIGSTTYSKLGPLIDQVAAEK
ncbi:TlpA family protein disulfide reductase [Actinomadura scrupuli]|uniref:TlpA family protein disulfide reductase n=1 Tax=Actinomadura scrupuli TaxID=559629 RepID=UPI003D993326